MVTGSLLYLRQLEVGPMENFVYLIGDGHKRECVMVDPAWEVGKVLEVARQDGMKVLGGLVTHTHFDHCNGVEELIEKTGGKIYVHKSEAHRLKGLAGHVEKTESGHKLKVGDLEILFLHTPGHTPGSQCFLISSFGSSEGEKLVSGDTLFINACGRCDLPGGDVTQMYHSLQRLAKLEKNTVLLPGHNYAERPTSTIGEELAHNPYYQCHSLAEFLRARTGV